MWRCLDYGGTSRKFATQRYILLFLRPFYTADFLTNIHICQLFVCMCLLLPEVLLGLSLMLFYFFYSAAITFVALVFVLRSQLLPSGINAT